MRRPDSIAARLVVTLLAGLTAVWLAGAGATIAILHGQLELTLDGGLRETAERILPLVADAMADADEEEADRADRKLADPSGGEYVVYQARRSDGSVAMRSHDAPSVGFAAPLAEGFATVPPWRVYTTGDTGAGLYVQVAEDEGRRAQALWQSAGAMGLPMLLLLPVAALGVLWAVRSGLRPLRLLGEEVSTRNAANLAPLAQSKLPSELRPVQDALNGLFDRLRAAFDAEKALTANSAHELRTPIAGSLAQTQRLVEELKGHPGEARARWVEGTLMRLAALATKLLALSRAEAGGARLPAPIDLLPALRLVVQDAGRELGPRLTLNIQAGTRLSAPLDIDAFGIALRNLIENADRHGAPDGPLIVEVSDSRVDVTSSGPAVPADRLAVLSHRFERGDTAAPGSGLGLAIVETIMRQVGGRLELFSPNVYGDDEGFTARLQF